MSLISLLFFLVACCSFWTSGMLAGRRREPWIVWQIGATGVTFGAQALYATVNAYHPALLVFPALAVLAAAPTLWRILGPKLRDRLLNL